MDNKHKGSSFEDFLKEEGIFEEVDAEAVKRVQEWLEQQGKEDLSGGNRCIGTGPA